MNKAYKNGKTKDTDLAQTPWYIIHQLEQLSGYPIKWDVCAGEQTKKAQGFFDEKMNALNVNWVEYLGQFEQFFMQSLGSHYAAWMNPPFSKAFDFTQKAALEASKGMVIIGCVKDAPDTDWYQQNVESKATVIYKPTSRIQFLKPDGSKFTRYDKKAKKWVNSGANFPVCFPVWTPLQLNQSAPIVRFRPDKTLCEVTSDCEVMA
jgi:phage N-6-adenine-methyltransferase